MAFVLIYGGCTCLVVGAFVLCMMVPVKRDVPLRVSFPTGFALVIAGCALVMGGIICHHQRARYVNDYESYVGDCYDFKQDQQAYRKDDQKFKHTRHQLHLNSVSGLHDPKIMNMTASQAQDFFIKRTRLQKKVKSLKKDCQDDFDSDGPSVIQSDLIAIKQYRHDIFVKDSNLPNKEPKAAFIGSGLKYNSKHPYLLTPHSAKVKLRKEMNSFDQQLK